MSIRTMCEANEPGAVLDEYWTKQAGRPIHLKETHAGLVLGLREANGRDDSDFYAIVWNPEKGATEEVMYASTRGWTYPNTAGVDATPEVLAAYEAAKAKAAQERREWLAAREAATPSKGRTVKLLKPVRPRDTAKPKAEAGEVGVVFWYGEESTFGPMYRNGYKARAREMTRYAVALGLHPPGHGYRVGVQFPDGRKVFLKATLVEVV